MGQQSDIQGLPCASYAIIATGMLNPTTVRLSVTSSQTPIHHHNITMPNSTTLAFHKNIHYPPSRSEDSLSLLSDRIRPSQLCALLHIDWCLHIEHILQSQLNTCVRS